MRRNEAHLLDTVYAPTGDTRGHKSGAKESKRWQRAHQHHGTGGGSAGAGSAAVAAASSSGAAATPPMTQS